MVALADIKNMITPETIGKAVDDFARGFWADYKPERLEGNDVAELRTRTQPAQATPNFATPTNPGPTTTTPTSQWNTPPPPQQETVAPPLPSFGSSFNDPNCGKN